MRTLIRDLRYGLRMLAKNPGFAAVAILTLALGIGANTAIFSVVYAALLRPLPYQEPGRLVNLGESRSQMDIQFSDNAYPDYLDWTRQAQSFESLAGYNGDGFILSGTGSPEVVFATRVTSNFFSTLGVKPALGRDFVAGEDQPNGAKVVILSHGFWKDHFGARPGAIGQNIRLDGETFVVVGVLPQEFEFAPTNSPPIWVPLNPNPDAATRRSLRWMHVVGRLKPGLTMMQAQTEMNTINARLAAAYPEENRSIRVVMGALRDQIVGQVRPLLWTLLGAVSFVLLIACANVANLLLARGMGRKREIAIRMALGAGHGQLLRQFLTESLLLALTGGTLGLLLSSWFSGMMLAVIPKALLDRMPYLGSVKTDPTVLVFTLLVAVATAILFGLAPALEAARADVNQGLKDEARSSAGRRASRLRDILVVAEIALALVLLAGAGLMLRSLTALLHSDPGFVPENLLAFGVALPSTSYKDEASVRRFEQQFRDGVRSLPGVQGVAGVGKLPLTGNGNTIRFVVEGRPTAQGQEDESNIRDITAAYFDVMKIPLVKGRFFQAADGAKQDAPRLVIVNQVFAGQYFPGENPVGKRIRFTFSPKNPFLEIVGVVGNENADQLGAPMPSIIYTSEDQGPDNFLMYVVRGSGRPENLLAPVRAVLRNVDAELPMINPETMDQVIAGSPSVFLRRYPSYLIGSFAALAVVLAMVGLYGLISFAVAERTRELGIRMALGAESRDLLRLVLRHGMGLALVGVAGGVAGAVALARLIAGLLYGVRPTDPRTLVTVSLLLLAVAALACFVPAWRATKVDPMVALRYE